MFVAGDCRPSLGWDLRGRRSVRNPVNTPQQIEFAREHRAHPAVNFETGDATALPFAEASFDVAVCGLGLNYVPEPERAIEEIRRVTVPEGVIASTFGTTPREHASYVSSGMRPRLSTAERWHTIRPGVSLSAIPRRWASFSTVLA
jgi:SAM-dependent methyltransferase